MNILDTIKEEWDEGWPERLVILFIIMVIILIISLIPLTISEEKAWNRFSKEHNCKVISKDSGTYQTNVITTIQPNGQVGTGTMTNYQPGKTGYKCDDGITYYR
jgi:hypothetical protein